MATELETVRTALVRIADSLARYFGYWGAVSRFAAREPAKETTAAADAVMDRKEQMEIESHTTEHPPAVSRPRHPVDVVRVRSLSYYDVRANAEGI